LEEFVNGMKQADLQSRQNGCDQIGRLIDVLRREYQIAPGPVLTATPLEVTAEMELEAAYPDQPLKQSDSELRAIIELTYGAKGSRTVDLRLLEESLSLDCGPDLGLATERAAARPGDDLPEFSVDPSSGTVVSIPQPLPELEQPATSVPLTEVDYESYLGFAVRLPAGFQPEVDRSIADEWLDSFAGPDGGVFRARGFDRADRSPFVDSVDPYLPDLEEVVHQMVALFPLEFGSSPVVQTIEFDGTHGWRIDPSEDATAQAGVTVILDGALPSIGRFLEVLISKAEFEEIFSSLHFL